MTNPKLSPAQIDVLMRPDRVKKQTATVDKLVSLELLEVDLRDPENPRVQRTPAGIDVMQEIERSKPNLTPEQLYEVSCMFGALRVKTRVEGDRKPPFVSLSLTDSTHGNMVVDTVNFVPTEAEALKIIKGMREDLKEKARKTRIRWQYIPK